MTADIKEIKIRRKKRVRAKIRGTAERPRLSVFRSNRYIYAQLINDATSQTLAAAHGEESKTVGLAIAEKAKKIGLKAAVFDRGAYKYHGRIKALAEAFKEGGVKL
jgi:large subunit ribosomal protein L18